MAEEKRLVGDDGKLSRGSLASDGVTDLENGNWYQISDKDSTSSIFGDLAIGDFYYAPVEISGVGDDEALLLTLSDMVDLSGWSLSITGDEIEVTVLDDKFKKYRKGKLDASGTASFVFIKGETDQPDAMANYYFDIAEISADGVVTFTPKVTDTMYVVGYLADEDAGEVSLATVLEVEFYNFELPMNFSEAVNMDIPFRLSGDSDPILYRISIPEST